MLAKLWVINVRIDSNTIANAVEDFCIFLEEDEDVVEFIEKYESDLCDLVAQYVELEESSLADVYKQFIVDVNENMDDTREMILESEYNYEVELATSFISTKLMKMTVYADSEQVLMLDVGSDGMKKSEKIILEFGETRISYDVNNYTKLINVVMKVNGEETVKYKLNKNSHEYTFRFLNTVELEGTITSKWGKTTITVEEIEVTDSDSGIKTKYESDITLIFDQSDRLPKAEKDFDRISDYEQDDFEDLFSKIDE